MAYGNKYVIPFKDDDLHQWRLSIAKENYSGIVYDDIILGEDPVNVEWQANDDFFNPIIGSSCKIELYVQSEYGGREWEDENAPANWEDQDYYTWDADAISFMQPDHDRQWRITVEYRSGGTEQSPTYSTYWRGFVVQDEYTRPLQVFPYKISFYASDLIGTINGYNYAGTTEQPTAFEAIRECLKNINLQDNEGTSGNSLEFGYKFLCRVKPKNSSDNTNPFTETHIMSKDAMKDENGNAVDCKTILESLLMMLNCRIFQHNGEWTIVSLDALSLSTFSGTGKNFITYDKDGANQSTYSITDPVQNINSTGDPDTIMPMNNDLVKIIKRPCVRHRTNVRIKDLYRNEFNNGNFELVASQGTGGVPTWGFKPNNWTIGDLTTSYCVNSNSIDTSQNPVVVYGITPYSGSFSLLNIGSVQSTPASPMVSNNTGNSISPTGTPIKLSFAAYANAPDRSGLLAYSMRWRLKIGSFYWDVNNDRWTTNSVVNTTLGAVQEQWLVYEFNLKQPSTAGTVEIDFYKVYEAVHNDSNFRLYYDDVKVVIDDDKEFYSTNVEIVKSTIKNNSGVLPAMDIRFGQIEDDAYINCLVDSSGIAIAAYNNYGSTTDFELEELMGMKRLNDMSTNNDSIQGTVRKLSDDDGSGNLDETVTPIDLLTLPKLNFTTVQSINNRLAIDGLSFSVKQNRYKIITHTPSQSNLTVASDINTVRNFYKFKPED